MRCTLLGTGDAVGVPAPLCDCAFCAASEPRRRPGLLVAAEGTTLLLDCPPDVTPALRAVGENLEEGVSGDGEDESEAESEDECAGVTDLDAVALTHGHYDHAGGLSELNHARYDRHLVNEAELGHDHPVADPFPTYVPRSVLQQYATSRPGLTERLDLTAVTPGEQVTVGPLAVTAVRVSHGEPLFPTLGFVVTGPAECGGPATVGYLPDLNEAPDPAALPVDRLDLLFAEGSVLGAGLHADPATLRAGLDRLPADRRVATNVSEHMLRLHTDALERRGRELGYEVWADGDAATV